MFSSTLTTLRDRSGLTQADIADKLGMARATYLHLEKGSREPSLGELRQLSELFQVSINELIDGLGAPNTAISKLPALAQDKNDIFPREVPALQTEKLREVLLYLLQKVGAKPNIGETVLYKLLYFIDFDYYEKYGRSITGLTYVKNHYGPTPTIKSFTSVIKAMQRSGELDVVETKYFKHTQKKYLPVVEPRLRALSAHELAHIDEEIARLSDKSAHELTDLSHRDTPWLVAKEHQPIDYQFVMYRTPLTAVKEPEDEL